MKVSVDGVEYEAKRRWTAAAWNGGDRALVDYGGVFVFVDQVSGDAFELSGTPARDGEEKDLLQALVDTIRTTTTESRS